MTEYRMKYKCRMCGEEFYDAKTANKEIAFGALAMLVSGKEIVSMIGMKFVHHKEDHCGIADLIGCDIIGGEEE